MKKNKKVIVLVLVVIILILSIVFVLNFIGNRYNNSVRYKGPSTKEPYKKKKEVKDGFGNEDNVELKYDQYVVASGYAGAADNVYYTRNNILYHLKLSTNETIRIAEGVKKIEEDIDSLKVYKGDSFRIITEDNYINYVE